MQDRADFLGRPWSAELLRRGRPEALVHVRQSFDVAESLFADGRAWVAGTPELSFADLEGVWVFDWMISDLAPPKEYISPEIYPNVYGWRTRFMAAVRAAAARAAPPVTLKGDAAVQAVLRAGFTDGELTVDPADPLALAAGADVEVYPTDSGGTNHRDRGELIKLTRNEVAVAVKAPSGEEVRVHAPRWKFRIQRAKPQKL
nr:hypothetical protein CFP56_36419 [Quercus suber]